MKRRIKFVSNSSSSSFVMIVPKKAHEKVLLELHPFVSAVVNSVMYKTNICGTECYIYHNLDIQGCDSEWEALQLDYSGEVPLTEFGYRMSISGAWQVYLMRIYKESIFVTERNMG